MSIARARRIRNARIAGSALIAAALLIFALGIWVTYLMLGVTT